MSQEINIGLIGFGTVGSGVVRILLEKELILAQRSGIRLSLKRIADKDITTPRGITVPPEILTTYLDAIIDDPGIDIVVELIGGIDEAKSIILKSISQGKPVVTANKALLAQHGQEIFALARKNRVSICFEAAVGGGIPIVKSLREGLIANRIQSILGIVNGTTNYILTKMTREGYSFEEALSQAQEMGYAESDPTLDLEGIDAAHKLVLLATLAFGDQVRLDDVYVEGISKLSLQDVKYAQEFGYSVKLLAIAKIIDHALELRVHPTMVPSDHLLASVDDAFNAIYVTGDAVGSMMFYGQGAGGLPAASAVVSDIVDLASQMRGGPARLSRVPYGEPRIKVRPIGQSTSQYYIRFTALDQPGVLAKISGILGRHNISIASVIQKGRGKQESVPVVMMTHEAKERDVELALKAIDRLPVIKDRSVLIRVEG